MKVRGAGRKAQPLARIERRTNINSANVDHGTVNLVDDVVDERHGVRVRDDLVAGEDILLIAGSANSDCHDRGAICTDRGPWG